MPRRTTTPAEEGIQAARRDYAAAMEQATQQEQTDQTQTPAPAELEGRTPAAPPMKVEARITSTRNIYDDPTRATATVVLGDSFVIKGFRVLKGESGPYVSMPARKLRDGTYSEVCHAITRDFSAQLKSTVLSEYQVYLAQQMEESHEIAHDLEGPEEFSPGMAEPEPEPDHGPVMGGM